MSNRISCVERTCREEGWILSRELVDHDPPLLQALSILDRPAWDRLLNELYSPSLRFFNTERGEFDSSTSWTQMARMRGIRALKDELAIPSDLTDEGKMIARQIRYLLVSRNTVGCGGCTAFPERSRWPSLSSLSRPDTKAVLMVLCDGGSLARYFNLDYGDSAAYTAMFEMLSLHGYYAEDLHGWCHHIYRK